MSDRRESRLPYVKEMIERMGLEAFLAAEVAAVRTRPVPMRLAKNMGKDYGRARLTAHEVRILALHAQGLRRYEVAEALHVSDETIKSHLKLVHQKLGTRNIPHALAVATERGYLG